MNIEFYWVLFFIALFVFATIGFGLSALFPADHPTRNHDGGNDDHGFSRTGCCFGRSAGDGGSFRRRSGFARRVA
ncbi:hypothetical protein [Paraburkholderia sediminicola]|uniref:hypothetical protein n=1 Tax=Paraburkholderia sediminicola TaxID=458836 RepID=UPI0038BB4B56